MKEDYRWTKDYVLEKIGTTGRGILLRPLNETRRKRDKRDINGKLGEPPKDIRYPGPDKTLEHAKREVMAARSYDIPSEALVALANKQNIIQTG